MQWIMNERGHEIPLWFDSQLDEQVYNDTLADGIEQWLTIGMGNIATRDTLYWPYKDCFR